MITERIQALFIFIEFLHSKIERFKQFDNVMKDLQILQIQRNELNPRKNFAEKIKYDQVQAELEQKVDIISENVIQVINTKALELNIYDFKKPETIWNWNVAEIGKLKEDFSEDDIPVILEHKHKYIEYRAKTQFTYFNDFFLII